MKVLLLEDHALFAKSLAIAFSRADDIHLSIAAELDAFWAMYDSDDFDILLLDINVNKDNGLELAMDVLLENPDQKIIILSGFDLPYYQYQAYEIGAKAFVHKGENLELLIQILRDVYDGMTLLHPPAKQGDYLTDREIEILYLIAQGMKQLEIANQLDISRRTVNNHIQSIIDKLEVINSIQAVIKASQLGIIRLEEVD